MSTKFKKSLLKSIILYNIFFILIAIYTYFLIPRILNYPPNSINTEFEKNIDEGYKFDAQYITTVFGVMILSNSIFLLEMKKIKGWEKYIDADPNDESNKFKIEKSMILC